MLDVWQLLTRLLSLHILSLNSRAGIVIVHHQTMSVPLSLDPDYTELKAVQYLAANKTGSFTSMNDNLGGRVGTFSFFL